MTTRFVLYSYDVCVSAAATESESLNIYAVNDYLTHTHGYSLNALQRPPCVHLCCTYQTVGKESLILAHIQEAVAHVQAHPELNRSGNAAVYGMTTSLPPGPVKDILKVYNDVVLDV